MFRFAGDYRLRIMSRCVNAQREPLMTPFYSMRLGAKQQSDFDNLVAFVDIFTRHRGSCDEVWFSTSYGYPTLDRHREIADRIVEAAAYVRGRGIGASLQISNTLGHGSYARVQDFSGFDWDDMVGPDGAHARYCCCPRDPRFLDYVSTLTSYYARIKPDYVWIDDDLRMHHHHPVEYGCFCDRCVSEFNRFCRRDYAREELVDAINDPDSSAVRELFVRYNQETLLLVASAVADAVMRVSPESTVGVQQASFAWSSYSGGNFHRLFEGIRKITGKPSAVRPGGGYYNDHAPRLVLDKALNLNLQTLRMPGNMSISQAEVENIPHNVSGKSVRGTLLESAIYLAYGCTSLSYSAFMIPNEPPAFHEPLMAALAAWRPFLLRYAALNRGTTNGGVGIVLSETHYKMEMRDKPPFAWASFRGTPGADVFGPVTYGLPLTWQNPQTPALLLHPAAVDGLSDEEIEDVFRCGVITDAHTVAKLNERGLKRILGLEVEEFDEVKSIDIAADHPLNADYVGQSWYHFYTTMGPRLPLKIVVENDRAEIIGNYVLRTDETVVTGVSGVLVETSLGGRAAVFGYNLWTNLVNSAKRHQILRAADWVSRDAMPAFLHTPSQVAVIPRVNSRGKLVSVMLVNVSIDSTPELSLTLRNGAGNSVAWLTPEREAEPLESAGAPEETIVRIAPMAPWSLGIVEVA